MVMGRLGEERLADGVFVHGVDGRGGASGEHG